jgi:hypothetical protein
VGECGRNPLAGVLRLLPPAGYAVVGALLRRSTGGAPFPWTCCVRCLWSHRRFPVDVSRPGSAAGAFSGSVTEEAEGGNAAGLMRDEKAGGGGRDRSPLRPALPVLPTYSCCHRASALWHLSTVGLPQTSIIFRFCARRLCSRVLGFPNLTSPNNRPPHFRSLSFPSILPSTPLALQPLVMSVATPAMAFDLVVVVREWY